MVKIFQFSKRWGLGRRSPKENHEQHQIESASLPDHHLNSEQQLKLKPIYNSKGSKQPSTYKERRHTDGTLWISTKPIVHTNLPIELLHKESSLSELELQKLLQERHKKTKKSNLHLFTSSPSNRITSAQSSLAACTAALEDSTSPLTGLLSFTALPVQDVDLHPEMIDTAFVKLVQLIQQARSGTDFSEVCRLSRFLLTRTLVRVCFGLMFLTNDDLQRRVIAVLEDTATEFSLRLEAYCHAKRCRPILGGIDGQQNSANSFNFSEFSVKICGENFEERGIRTVDEFPIHLPSQHWSALSILVILGRLLAEASLDFAVFLSTSPLFSKALAHIVVEGLTYHAAIYFIDQKMMVTYSDIGQGLTLPNSFSSSNLEEMASENSQGILEATSQKKVSVTPEAFEFHQQHSEKGYYDEDEDVKTELSLCRSASIIRNKPILTVAPSPLPPYQSELLFSPSEDANHIDEDTSYDISGSSPECGNARQSIRKQAIPSEFGTNLFAASLNVDQDSLDIHPAELGVNGHCDKLESRPQLSDLLCSHVISMGSPPGVAVSFAVDDESASVGSYPKEPSESRPCDRSFQLINQQPGTVPSGSGGGTEALSKEAERSDDMRETGVRTNASSWEGTLSPRTATVEESVEDVVHDNEELACAWTWDTFSSAKARLEAMKVFPMSIDRFLFGSIYLDMAAIPGIERKLLLILEYLREADEAEHLVLKSGCSLLDAITSSDKLYQSVSTTTSILISMLRLLAKIITLACPQKFTHLLPQSSMSRVKCSQRGSRVSHSVNSSPSSTTNDQSSATPSDELRFKSNSSDRRSKKSLWTRLFGGRKKDQTEDIGLAAIGSEHQRITGASTADVLEEITLLAKALLLKFANCKYHHFHVTDSNTRPTHFGIPVESLGCWTSRPTRGMLTTCNFPSIAALRGAQESVYLILAFLAERQGGPWRVACDCKRLEALLVLENIFLVTKKDAQLPKLTRVSSKFTEFSHCCYCGRNCCSIRYASNKPLKKSFVVCNNCNFVRYCSTNCEKEAFIVHETFCQAVKAHFSNRFQ